MAVRTAHVAASSSGSAASSLPSPPDPSSPMLRSAVTASAKRQKGYNSKLLRTVMRTRPQLSADFLEQASCLRRSLLADVDVPPAVGGGNAVAAVGGWEAAAGSSDPPILLLLDARTLGLIASQSQLPADVPAEAPLPTQYFLGGLLFEPGLTIDAKAGKGYEAVKGVQVSTMRLGGTPLAPP